jgi:hypothetical protein
MLLASVVANYDDLHCIACLLRRTAEEVRNFGPSEPPVKGLVQGEYSHAWVDMNLARQVGGV